MLNRKLILGMGLVVACGGEEIAPVPRVSSPPLAGFADLHNHQFGEYAYQGAWYHGSTLGPEGGDGEQEGMSACDGNHRGGPQDHAMSYANILCSVAGWATEDTCVHTDRRYGYDAQDPEQSYSGWPHPASLAHQQNWWGHIQDAWEDGLRLMVVPAVNFRILCQLMEPDNFRYFYDCEDLGAVDLEIQAAKEFVAIHHDWVEIAYTPEDARRIISAGKLALILAIEVTDIFPTGGMDYAPMVYDSEGRVIDRGGVFTQLEHYYDLGVRTLQLGHELDSRFSGVAVYSPVFKLLAAISEYKQQHPSALPDVQLRGDGTNSYGFELDDNGYNTVGLSSEGEQLIQALMDLGMPLDLAHLSRKSQERIYELARANQYYPLFHSHAKLTEILVRPGDDDLEKFIPDSMVDKIRVTGGMMGLRTISEPADTYPLSGVANNCDGSTRSFAQLYRYADAELNIPVGYAVDMNGFATQMGPRFGDEGCGKAGDESLQLSQQAAQTDMGTGTLYDWIGLGHVGLLGRGLHQDLRNLGVDTTNLDRSAEAFVSMWERARDPSRNTPVGPPPVGAESSITRKSTEAGLMVVSILPGKLAQVGDYNIQVRGTGANAVAELRRGTTLLASVPYNEGASVSESTWYSFRFGDILTLKIAGTSGTPISLDGLDTSFFNGVRTLTLAWP